MLGSAGPQGGCSCHGAGRLLLFHYYKPPQSQPACCPLGFCFQSSENCTKLIFYSFTPDTTFDPSLWARVWQKSFKCTFVKSLQISEEVDVDMSRADVSTRIEMIGFDMWYVALFFQGAKKKRKRGIMRRLKELPVPQMSSPLIFGYYVLMMLIRWRNVKNERQRGCARKRTLGAGFYISCLHCGPQLISNN